MAGAPPHIDWPGLLKWSTSVSDGTRANAAAAVELTPERRAFLERAFEQLRQSAADPAAIVAEAAAKLRCENVSEPDALHALLLIERCVDEDPEASRRIDQLGALEPIIDVVRKHCEREKWKADDTEDSDSKRAAEVEIPTGASAAGAPASAVCERALRVLAFVLQNNPAVQRAALALGLLDLLAGPSSERGGAPRAACDPYALGALSALLRQNAEACVEFLRRVPAPAFFLAAARSDDDKVVARSANLLRHLLDDGCPFSAVCGETALDLFESFACRLIKYEPFSNSLQANETIVNALASMAAGMLVLDPSSLERCDAPLAEWVDSFGNAAESSDELLRQVAGIRCRLAERSAAEAS